MTARSRAPALCLALFALTGCAGGEGSPSEGAGFAAPETAVDYVVMLEGVEDERAEDLLRKALAVYRRRDDGAQSLAFLRRRAQGDVPTALKIMRSFGYYEATVNVDVDEASPEEAAEVEAASRKAESDEEESEAPSSTAAAEDDEADDGSPRQNAIVRLTIDQKRPYVLERHRLLYEGGGDGDLPAAVDAAEFGSPVGDRAAAAKILAAEDAALVALRAGGRPYAERRDRDAVADTEAATLAVDTTIAPGRAYSYGEVRYEGNETVDADYLETYRTFEPGETVSPDDLKTFQRALIATGLFNAGSAAFPDDPPDGSTAPVIVTLEEAPPRTISGGVRFDTDAGPAVRGGFEHRNLFGANETITLETLVGLEEQSFDAAYRLPQYARSGQDLIFGLNLRHIDDEAFEEFGGTVSVGVEREITDQLLVGAGVLAEISRIEDDEGKDTSKLLGLPLFAAVDTTDDRLDPTKGARSRLSVTPFAGVISDTAAGFGVIDLTGSSYLDLTGERRFILATRARIASIISGDLDIVAANRRLYSGGGGSVRGYAERFIGPLDDDGDPVGGLSAVEAGVEMRARVTSSIGFAGFVEAGSVSTEVAPVFDDGVQVAIGGGVRYFSPIGPLRFDIGFPVNGRDEDDTFQIYISIGQAF